MTPAELLLGCIPPSQIDLLKPPLPTTVQQKPEIAVTVQQKQQKQKAYHDTCFKLCEFSVNGPVFVRDFPLGKKWLTGIVCAVKGPLSYHITLSDGRIVRQHVDHVRSRTSSVTDSDSEDDLVEFSIPLPVESPETLETIAAASDSTIGVLSVSTQRTMHSRRRHRPPLNVQPRHSNRIIHPSDRFGYHSWVDWMCT